MSCYTSIHNYVSVQIWADPAKEGKRNEASVKSEEIQRKTISTNEGKPDKKRRRKERQKGKGNRLKN